MWSRYLPTKSYEIKLKILAPNLISDIYSNDSILLFLNEDLISEIDMSFGIKQGGNLSGLLFILVTYL